MGTADSGSWIESDGYAVYLFGARGGYWLALGLAVLVGIFAQVVS